MLKHDALIAKTRVTLAIAELTPKKKTGRGRKLLSPSVRDNCRLCIKFGSHGDRIRTENLFQPSIQSGSFQCHLVWSSQTCTCESVGLPIEYWELRIKSDRVCGSCGRKIRTLHRFVSSALFGSENEKSESEERFKIPVQALPFNVGFFSWSNSTGDIGCISWDDWCGCKSQRKASRWDAGLVQHHNSFLAREIS